MNDFEYFVKQAGDFHGHICVGLALGTKISLAALRVLGMQPGVKNKNLIVYTEIDRCMSDAVQVVTKCTLGRRSLKYADYGKFAATFINLDTGKAVRATVKEHFSKDEPIEKTLERLATTPDHELVTLEEVTVDIPETDLPGSPQQRAICARCGERVMDGREVVVHGTILCRACARNGYYRLVGSAGNGSDVGAPADASGPAGAVPAATVAVQGNPDQTEVVDFFAIDWNAMWQAETKRGHFRPDRAAARELWDKRAETFARGMDHLEPGGELDPEDYISQMLSRIEVRPEWTVLDIGPGPGVLAIPLAKKVKSVTALDISLEMLNRLKANADRHGLTNIQCVNVSWQDAFGLELIGKHDVVVASRSLMAGDMKAALSYIVAIADRAAYLTFPIIHLPFDWEVYKVIGREKKHPPYIYLVNLLYQMGVHANVEILRSRARTQFSSVEEALTNLEWRTDPFTPEEKAKLRDFLEGQFAEQGGVGPYVHEGYAQWALLWWKTAK